MHTNWNICLKIQKCLRQLLSAFWTQTCRPFKHLCDFSWTWYFSLIMYKTYLIFHLQLSTSLCWNQFLCQMLTERIKNSSYKKKIVNTSFVLISYHIIQIDLFTSIPCLNFLVNNFLGKDVLGLLLRGPPSVLLKLSHIKCFIQTSVISQYIQDLIMAVNCS